MAIPTQQTISKGSVANDGTGDSLRDAADKINNNFANLWQAAYNNSDDWPGKKFVIGTTTSTTNTKPFAGEINTYNPNDNMKDYANFRISQTDQLGSKMTMDGPQMDYNNNQWDSVQTPTVLTMYQKVTVAGFSNYKVVGQYIGQVYFKTTSKPATSPPANARFPSAFNFLPDSSDYWHFIPDTTAVIYGSGHLSAGDSCFIKLDKFW